jgi:curved DNA-binding protein CbpA
MKGGDYYRTLGVHPDASPEEIRTAYHRLARTCHPDVSGLPDSEERMKEINAAYAVLSDPEKRREYDHSHPPPRSVPARQESRTSGDEAPRGPHTDPRYEPARPAPAGQHSCNKGISRVTVFGISLFFLLLLLLAVLLPGWAPRQAAAEEPPVVTVSSLSPSLTVTPLPESTPDAFGSWVHDGDILAEQGRNGDALAAYDRALALRPDASWLRVAEGDLFVRMGNFKSAISCYDRALAANASVGDDVRTMLAFLENLDAEIGRAEQLADDEDYAGAIAIYDTILAAGIPNSDFRKRILSAKVYALMRAGRPDEAANVSGIIASL